MISGSSRRDALNPLENEEKEISQRNEEKAKAFDEETGEE